MRQKIDVRKNLPPYSGAGRAPGTTEQLVNCTVLLEEEVRDKLVDIARVYVCPRNLRSYGLSAIVRYYVSLGVQSLSKKPVKEKDLLYYLDKHKEGVGRHGVPEAIKTVFSLRKSDIVIINRYRDKLNSPIIGTTSFVRYFIHKHIDKVTVDELYQMIPEKDKIHMISEKLTPRKLAKLAKSAT